MVRCIEGRETLASLSALGVDYAQGFGVEEPITVREIGRRAAPCSAA